MEQQDNQEKIITIFEPQKQNQTENLLIKKKKNHTAILLIKKKIKQQTFQRHYKPITGMSKLEKEKRKKKKKKLRDKIKQHE